MSKYFNFDIFLAALSIISVAHANHESSNLQNLSSETPVAYNGSVSPLGLLENEVLNLSLNIIGRVNMYRKNHGCDPLILDQNLVNHAQEKANNLALQNHTGVKPKDENKKYGQTIFASAPWNNFEDAAVDAWYNEMRFINEGDGEEDLYKNREKIGNMIQLFWKKSRDFGVGVAKNDKNQYFIVAEYNPKGNLYPFLSVNLPSFSQKYIDAAKIAQDKLEKRMKTMALLKYLEVEKPIPGSNNVFAYNSSQVYTFGSRIVQYCFWKPSPNPLTKAIMNPYGGVTVVKIPPEQNPIACNISKPHQMTPEEVEEIRRDVLRKSNYYRNMYKIPSLKIHEQLNCYAQKWANHLAKKNQFKHRPKEEFKRIYGETINRSNKVLYLGELAVDMWYYEVGSVKVTDKDDDFYNNDSLGPLTQLLWMRSRQMGVGVAVDGYGYVIIVANFNPGGNVQNFYVDNLPTFKQEQIDEGHRLNNNIKDALKKKVKLVMYKQLPFMPGWKSDLHVTLKMTSESENNPSLPEGSKIFLRDGRRYIATMPKEIPVDNHDCELSLGLSESEATNIRFNVVYRVNILREHHGFHRLTTHQKLINHAQEMANALALQNQTTGKSKDKNGLYGQTIFVSSPWNKFEEAAVDTWYNEMRFIHEGDGEEDLYKNREKIGNMIQLFWKISKNIGVGVAKNDNNQYFIVVEYNPKGNFYPFLSVNLPSFSQKYIDAAKIAQDKLEKRMKTMALLKYLEVEKPVLGSNNVFAYNSSQVFTFGSRIVQSGWKPSPNPLTKAIMNPYGGVTVVKIPPEQNPIACNISKPHQLTPEEVEEIRRDVLRKSNHYRDMYKMPRLELHDQIDCYAQKWANNLAINNRFQHRPKEELFSGYGETIHISIRTRYSGELAVDLWYYQIGSIKITNNDNDLFKYDVDSVGHVSQLLWKRSKQIGVGAAVNADGKVIVVANFNPGGNVEHFYVDNLPSFTQEQIDDGRILNATLQYELKKHMKMVVPGATLESLPGWTSYLHTETYEDSEPLGLTRNEIEGIQNGILVKTNQYRKKYKMPQLVRHEQIDHYAQWWANYLAKNNLFQHRSKEQVNSKYGENLYKGKKVTNIGDVAVDLWYSEVGLIEVNDNYNKLYARKDIENVTQLLWKQSVQMGVGAAVNEKGHVVIVANFNPGRNLEDLYSKYLPTFTHDQIDEGKKLKASLTSE